MRQKDQTVSKTQNVSKTHKTSRTQKPSRTQNKKKQNKLKRVNAWAVIVITFTFVAITGFLTWMQMQKYEEGILSVYATQQDGYVQLVLDQINLKDNRQNKEMIEEILQTLDTSSNRYWTLSEQNSIIFVKDVLETNRYKGLTTESYYKTYSADAFIQQLKVNHVSHAQIEMNDTRYVASGVIFEYNGNEYYLCLLTNADTVLDQNEYLNAKISLMLLAVLVFAFFVIGCMVLAVLAEKWYQKYDATERENRNLVDKIEKINHEMSKDLVMHPNYSAFHINALKKILEKMEQKDVWPLEMLLIHCPDGEKRKHFFAQAQIRLNDHTIRVILDDRFLLLLTMKKEETSDETSRKEIKRMGGKLVARAYIKKKPTQYLSTIFAKMYKEVQASGQ